MNAFLTALFSKFSGSSIATDVGGRIYFNENENNITPYLIYSITTSPTRTFTERYTDIRLQIDLFALQSAGTAVMTTMYADLIALLDECSLNITGYTLVWMREISLIATVEDVSAAQDGSCFLNHWIVDFDVRISLN